MKLDSSTEKHEILVRSVADFILSKQLEDGAIPWFTDGKLDPWDHCEAIMALSIAGQKNSLYRNAALAGFEWLAKHQHPKGYWFAKYLGDCGQAENHETDTYSEDIADRNKIETNFVAYPATALWHFYLVNGDIEEARNYYPMIERAINYIVSQQHSEGDIQWATSTLEELPKDALVTASASVLRSLECAICLADALDYSQPTWRSAHAKLAEALKTKPWRFDRTWESKTRFSMDWFYPILSGVFSRSESQLRIGQRWDTFFVEGLGCKCVADEPWVTIAESCELVIALVAAGQKQKALDVFQLLLRWQDTDGGFWTGYVYKDDAIWPEEKTTWTAAAIVLAADAIFKLSPANKLFTSPSGLLV